MDYELIWLVPGETMLNRERYIIQSPKLKVMVPWNTTGYYVLASLPNDTKCNIGYYKSEILE
jgi:hypothetical protein